MKIINDLVDLIELQNLKTKDLLKRNKNEKIILTLIEEKFNDAIYLKRSQKLLAIQNFFEFIIYLATYFQLKCCIQMYFLSHISIILCCLIIIIQITLQITKAIPFKYLRLISYFLYFNIYFYFLTVLITLRNDNRFTENENHQ